MKEQKTVITSHPIRKIILKFFILFSILIAIVIYCDYQGFFISDTTNNHTIKKWNAYYDFTQNNEVDVLLVGNSHLYTGINPKNLSTALSCNAFILASPGTGVVDHYYVIEEAIKVSKPSILVVETYGVKGISQYDLTAAALSDQIKSFVARKNILLKIQSTPHLFKVNNYPYAWSSTVRNHSFLYTNFAQIKENNKPKTLKDNNNDLYLGRYVRFQTGLTDSTLQKYTDLGAPVDGAMYEMNTTSELYLNKIINLCAQEGIELIFLTLPMYPKHIKNYTTWKSTLGKSLGQYADSLFWLDLQEENKIVSFDENSFEDTYNSNQHMTYSGSLIATYQLVNFIHQQKRFEHLPNRALDLNWISIFKGQEGFIENQSPLAEDDSCKVIYLAPENKQFKELVLVKNDKNYVLIAKIKANNLQDYEEIKTKILRINCSVINPEDQKNYRVNIDLFFDAYHSTANNMVYTAAIKKVAIPKVFSIDFY